MGRGGGTSRADTFSFRLRIELLVFRSSRPNVELVKREGRKKKKRKMKDDEDDGNSTQSDEDHRAESVVFLIGECGNNTFFST